MNKISGIYAIRHAETGKVYIGSSINIKQRWNAHKSALQKNIHDNEHLQNAWNKYGKEAFVFEILEEDVSEELFENKENDYIVKYRIASKETNIFDNEKGYNMCWSGREGCVDPAKYKRGEEHHLYGRKSPKKGKTYEEMYGEEKARKLRDGVVESNKGNKKGAANKGNCAWNKGLEGEELKKFYKNGGLVPPRLFGYRWINNGEKQGKLPPNKELPEGWKFGGLKR
jgi:group I intron endonuclease